MFRSRRANLNAWLMACAMTVACSGDGEAKAEAEVDASGSNEVASTTEDAAGSHTEAAGEDDSCLFSSCYFDTMDACGSRCDVWAPDDCPDGQKCAAKACDIGSPSWDTFVCVDIMGHQQLGEPCSAFGDWVDGLDDCAEGLMCWRGDPSTEVGTCIANCTGPASAPSCPSGYTCELYGSGVPAPCTPSCDPLAQDCEPWNVCLPYSSDAFVCKWDASGEAGAYASPCEFANACDPGLLCLDASVVPEPSCEDALGCCTPYCDLSLPNTCPGAGQVCAPLFDPQLAGYENVGVCAVMQP